jgi:hypothetical protein
MRNSFSLALALVALALPLGLRAGQSDSTEPLAVTPCAVANDPAAYNPRLIKITGFVSHGFEDFTILDPTCSTWPPIWLEYGGTAKSGTMYCCGVTADRSRPKPLEVEGISIPLVDDEHFCDFDRLVQRSPDSIVRAAMVGRFFEGQPKSPGRLYRAACGHMGCCSLLAIQQILSVDPQSRKDLDHKSVCRSTRPYEGRMRLSRPVADRALQKFTASTTKLRN